jgi:hypothetical protein
MLLALQLPFADLRRLARHQSRLISKPSWPSPQVSPEKRKEFVRCFGGIEERGRKGLQFWGEDRVCNVRRGIRFPSLRPIELSTGQRISIALAYRRLYFDGLAMGKFEVGLSIPSPGLNLTGGQLKEFLIRVLDIQIQTGNESLTAPLFGSQEMLLASYSAATTRTSGLLARLQAALLPFAVSWQEPRTNGKDKNLVVPGEPILFLERFESEIVGRLPLFVFPGPVLDQYGFSVDCYTLPVKGQNLRLYGLTRKPDLNYTVARAVRLSLMRLHAEHECMRCVSRGLLDGHLELRRDRDGFNALQKYIDDAITRVTRSEQTAKKLSGADLVELSREIADVVSPGERESVISLLENAKARRNIVTKFKQYANVFIERVEQMGDTYNTGQAGAVGPAASAVGTTFNNNYAGAWNNLKADVDLAKLAAELATIQAEAKSRAATADQFSSLANLASAREAAEKGDGPTVMEHLKRAGKWIWELAKEVGTSVAAKVIEASVGIQ